MTHFNRVFHSLKKEGWELVDMKIFLGSERNVTPKQICDQLANAFNDIKMGAAELITNIDRKENSRTMTVEQFLK